MSNGSAVNALARQPNYINEAGRPVTFLVGDSREIFGSNLAHLDGPKYADGSLPIVQLVYQTDGESLAATRRSVDSKYVLTRDKRVHFKIAAYDKTKPLIIDPVLTYSTYLGNGSEIGMDVAVDASGNAYIAGTTNSASFPITAGAYQPVLQGGCINSICGDVFVAKLDPSGSILLYSTFLGGSGGDYASSIAVDSAGNAYITGATNSTDFPLSNPLQASYGGGPSDAFVAKLPPSGSSLIYSGYLGGAGQDQGTALAVDSSGSAYVVGSTSSASFAPATAVGSCGAGNLTHAFVSKLNTAGNGFAYKTCLGGNGTDQASAVAINSSGYAYVVGSTSSTNFPTTARAYQRTLKGSQDAFIAVLNSVGLSSVQTIRRTARCSNRWTRGSQCGMTRINDSTSTVSAFTSPAQPIPATFQSLPEHFNQHMAAAEMLLSQSLI